MNIDYFIFFKINNFAGKFFWLDALGIFFAKYFEYFLIFFLLLFLVKNYKLISPLPVIALQLNKKYLPMVIQAFTAAILARLVIIEIIRYFLPRSRPFVNSSVNILINYSPKEPSFPSGHAAFYFAISTVIYLYNKKAGLLFFLASFLIVISRVFVGIHWPSDILAGALIGIFSGLLIILAFRRLFSTAKK